jgi:hypothetical protein
MGPGVRRGDEWWISVKIADDFAVKSVDNG